MLCQRASLCPVNTQEDKHQQITEVTVGTELFAELDHYQGPNKCLTPLTIYALDAEQVITPLYPP